MGIYVDKIEFHNQLKDYRDYNVRIEDLETSEEPQPSDEAEILELMEQRDKVYNKIGKNFLLIATNYLNRPFYINYSKDWKDDMISEGVYDMIRYIDNYKVDMMETRWHETGRTPDPFSYFSTYIYNGIMRFLKDKKKDKDVLVRLPFIENIDKRDMPYE